MRRLTRRQFLVGGAASGAVAVGGSGVVAARNVDGIRRFLHRHGVLSGPDLAVPDVEAQVDYGTLDGPGGAVQYGLYLPAAPTVVLYALHGRGGTHRDPFDSTGLHRFVAQRNLPYAVASIGSGETFWHRRADGRDPQRDLLSVLMPFVASKASGATSAVIGWSMGGYGALLLAQQHPEVFAVAVAGGPAIWTSFGSSTGGAFDGEADFRANDVLAGASHMNPRTVRVDCGTDDPFAGAVRELARLVPDADIRLRDGYHEDATWRSYLPGQLDFIAAHIG